jgi:hypothetical protein
MHSLLDLNLAHELHRVRSAAPGPKRRPARLTTTRGSGFPHPDAPADSRRRIR